MNRRKNCNNGPHWKPRAIESIVKSITFRLSLPNFSRIEHELLMHVSIVNWIASHPMDATINEYIEIHDKLLGQSFYVSMLKPNNQTTFTNEQKKNILEYNEIKHNLRMHIEKMWWALALANQMWSVIPISDFIHGCLKQSVNFSHANCYWDHCCIQPKQCRVGRQYGQAGKPAGRQTDR